MVALCVCMSGIILYMNEWKNKKTHPSDKQEGSTP